MVNVQRPRGNIYRISTPVFNNIMGRVLTKFNVPPSTTPPVGSTHIYDHRSRFGEHLPGVR